jgi:class 3 adenylate cyclase
MGNTLTTAHRFFNQLGDPILVNHGVINKYLGDGMLALFGSMVRRARNAPARQSEWVCGALSR